MKTNINLHSYTPKVSFKQSPEQLPQIVYSKETGIAYGLNFQSPLQVTEALEKVKEEKKLNSGVAGYKDILEKFIKDLSSKQKEPLPKVTKLVTNGSSAILFETENGDIIKITRGNHFPLNRPHQNFDVPIFKQGKAGKTYYYIEEKLFQHNLSDGFVETVKKFIENAGFRPYDLDSWDIHQIGISKTGKLYLLDPECARYKTIFHALFDKMKHLRK